MPDASFILPATLFGISALMATVLLLSWLEFGRPRHALSWTIAFALFACAWAVRTARSLSVAPEWTLVVVLCLSIWGLTLDVLGFRQRAGMPERRGILFAAALVTSALMIVAARPTTAVSAWLLPFAICVAGLCLLAAASVSGRRRSERAATAIAHYGMIVLASAAIAVAAGAAADRAGLAALDIGRLDTLLMLLLPGAVTASGLFVILLLAADLADRTRRLAATDMLTGLLNRRGLEAAVPRVLDSARRGERPMTLALFDIDHFKQINDRFGHGGGDMVLRAVADFMRQTLAPRDLAARIGGEEFAVLMTDAGRFDAAHAAERLRAGMERCAEMLTRDFCVTASFGLTDVRADDAELAGLLARADMALYRSKDAGRNCVTWAT
ncbi:GGDEF domain-containing protein [Sphingomonas nostoxanthinifaciens]|uniref:GGDEF domain-containing protein n=1 Tax=Sphingomonas nostoxanthinifaciens TaxID=2872652 RepID=UPI001CC1D919|nr:GGDEF domain-containing protein [Sphingomonas nostoxanthinifaciens]UAK25405.1 GGDEF domain-containing protein [Sphingomonas nostoxanthinifaciens]